MKSSAVPRGFTLLELLVYIGIAGIVVAGVSSLLFMTLTARIRTESISEVEQQGVHVLRVMTQAVRSATTLQAPASGTGQVLTIDVADAALSPTTFSVVDGTLMITQGAGSSVALTSRQVAVDTFSVTSVTTPGSPGAVRIVLQLSRRNAGGQYAYSYEQTFYATASLR
ncbi:MAG: PilW family protein [Patescibacteria group bacterium]